MARTVRDANLQTRAARLRLKPRGKPYYRGVDHGLHIGYRRSPSVGRWVVRVYIGDQNYKVETIGTADDVADADGVAVLNWSQAQEKARQRRSELVRVEAGLPAASGPYTVQDAVEAYLAWLEKHSRSSGGASARNARWDAEAHILPKLGRLECAKLTEARIEKWHEGVAASPPRLRSKTGAAKVRHADVDMSDPETVRRCRLRANHVLTILKAALNMARDKRRVLTDDAWRHVKLFRDVDVARVRYFQVDECRRLVRSCEEDFGELVQGGLHTGARYGELARLEPSDFNADVGTIAVRRSKTGKPRHVVLTEEGRAFFASLVRRAANRKFLFVRADGQPWNKSWQHRPMTAACAKANIERAGFHTLRHTWASHAVMNGVPLLVVAKNLGHTDTRMVEKHYGHLAPSYIADEIRRGAPRFGIA
jgi:integrase